MNTHPASCTGCPLNVMGQGFMAPSLAGAGAYGVTLLGEALGEDEAAAGRPFVGRAGFKLSRLLEWAGLDRDRFDILNAAWCRPPNNQLEGTPYERGATSHCREAHWGRLLNRSSVVVPMGNVPLAALTGRKGILQTRGYFRPGEGTYHILPTVHPSFIQRGQSKYSAAFIHDIQKAVEVARTGLPMERQEYLLDPPAGVAYAWAKKLVASNPVYISYDIETPGKGDDEAELNLDTESDPTFKILRVGFSYISKHALGGLTEANIYRGEPGGLESLSIPFSPEYFSTIRLVLSSRFPKVVWNGGFDNPRLKRAGFDIAGVIHDGMIAWHVLHSDMPKGLGFVATFTCPYIPEWKNLAAKLPAFYNATDADVELRSMIAIERELRATGLWDVYDRDVIQLDPVLRFMEAQGMPIDPEVRLDRAEKLAEKNVALVAAMEEAVPFGARRVAYVYKKTPADITGLLVRPGVRTLRVCSICGAHSPAAAHFKTFKKKVNSCAGAEAVEATVAVDEYYRLADFKPSRDQLMRYQGVMDRPVPTTYDNKTRQRKPSMDEKALQSLTQRYPDDRLYPLVLQFREVQKIAGTYIGYPAGTEQS